MEYSIPEINDGVAKVVYSDGSWVLLTLAADMTEADLDDIVYQIAPPSVKAGETPSFLSAGSTRAAAKKPIPEPEASHSTGEDASTDSHCACKEGDRSVV